MNQHDPARVAEAFWKALSAGDLDEIRTYMHEDFVQEWPQSGERIVGRDNSLAINRNFPGGLPSMKFRRVLGGGNLAVVEVDLEYADGSRYLGVSVMELRDGKIAKDTDYFGEPFPPPEWRAQWVERM